MSWDKKWKQIIFSDEKKNHCLDGYIHNQYGLKNEPK